MNIGMKKSKTIKCAGQYIVDLINSNRSRNVQEECANRFYRVYSIHSSNMDGGEEPDGLWEEAPQSLSFFYGSACQMEVK